MLCRRVTRPTLLLTLVVVSGLLVGAYLTRERNLILANGQFVLNITAKLAIVSVLAGILLFLTGNHFTLQWPVGLGATGEQSRSTAVKQK